jgi:hypothetical protein
MKLLLNAKEFIFLPKPDQYYLGGHPVECESDCTDWKEDKLINDGWGFFNGLTMVSYRGYVGELPRMDGDSASFDEFDIYYGEILINDMTWGSLMSMINRDRKLETLV